MAPKHQLIGPLRRSKRLQSAKQFPPADSSTGPLDDSSSVSDDPFDALDSEDESEGEDYELHVYDSRCDTRGDRTLLRASTNSNLVLQKPASLRAGFILIRYFSPTKVMESTFFEIRSPFAKQAIRDVIKSYPGVNINSTGKIVLFGTPRCLFHYRTELSAYADSHPDKRVRKHVRFCLKYMKRTLSREIHSFSANVEQCIDQPGLEERDLWLVFKPGTLVAIKERGTVQVARVTSIEWLVVKFPVENAQWHLSAENISCNADNFRLEGTRRILKHYEGVKAFVEQEIYPLEHHPRCPQIRAEALERGRRFISMVGIHHFHYTGPAEMVLNLAGPVGLAGAPRTEVAEIDERVLLDHEGYEDVTDPTRMSTVAMTSKTYPADSSIVSSLTEGLMICKIVIGGFSLGLKRWALFRVDHVQDIEFNSRAFDSLALSPEKKSLIMALVRSHALLPPSTEIIKGKGRGLNFLLHGPPGVGKTFTAECIADYIQRPLYRLDSTSIAIESQLVRELAQAQKWGAIALLDEADVFMQKRDLHNLHRNSVVSTLLRHLEYFGGILFLTTNRMNIIDNAFKSRIHLSISYPPLSDKSKRELWETGLTRANAGNKPSWLTRSLLLNLAQKDTNGREINNLIHIAQSLALGEKRDMVKEDVLKGLNALQSFNAEIRGDSSSEASTN
ncbi:P-loop containing nucleoside triphosphate hydrolase protein [Xylaria arbuscula]|nr:P-loop containing nucleoside triphosphate hydrolase protein [Xylaria arbuscula]